MNLQESDITAYLDQEGEVTKRELARAFNVSGTENRRAFKDLLKDMEKRGVIQRGPGQRLSLPESMPSVCVVEITEVDTDGELWAVPRPWERKEKPPSILIEPDQKGRRDLGEGDRALVRLRKLEPELYGAKIIKRLDAPSGQVIGMLKRQSGKNSGGLVLVPADKKARQTFPVVPGEDKGASPGELVVGEIQPVVRMGPKPVRVVEIIGDQADPKAISLIAVYEHGIKQNFPEPVLRAAEGLSVPQVKGREELRSKPLVTIDGADAKDFDDAVHAVPDTDPQNPGGYWITVAIADVSHYVQPGTPLDLEAYERGNSTYFPDRVVPMLPEALSNGLCSLVPGEDRACMGFHMQIDAKGHLKQWKLFRGLMRSAARLTYERVQAAIEGQTDEETERLLETVIRPLFAAFRILESARRKRGALELDIEEKHVILDEEGRMSGVQPRQRLEAHKLIEEFMILANVATAQACEAKNAPCLYRVHDRPKEEKLEQLRDFLDGFGYSIPKGSGITPHQFNSILETAEERGEAHIVQEVVLRSQAQAHYSPENIGHYGLGLDRYAHFTSPIRRYADLVVHRSLVKAYGLGGGGISDGEVAQLDEIAEHISGTERVSAQAERDALDRFTSAFLADKVGAEFAGRINGVSRFGLFVTLQETGADGLVPIRSLPDDYYIHDETQHALIGRRSGRVYQMGAPVTVALRESDGLTGSCLLELVDGLEGAQITAVRTETGPQKRQKNKGDPSQRSRKDATKHTSQQSKSRKKKPGTTSRKGRGRS